MPLTEAVPLWSFVPRALGGVCGVLVGVPLTGHCAWLGAGRSAGLEVILQTIAVLPDGQDHLVGNTAG